MSDDKTEEFEALVARADELGIPGALRRMKPETLAQKIAQAEAATLAPVEPEAIEPEPEGEPRYTVERLRTERILPGVARFVIAGALHGMPDDATLTAPEAAERVQKFMSTPIEQPEEA